MSLVAPVIALLRRWRLVLGLPVALAIVAVAYSILTRDYTATSSFVPESPGGQRSQLGGLALQLGFVFGGAEPAVSVDFYRNLLESRTVLTDATLTRYRFATRPGGRDTLEGALLDLYQIQTKTSEARLRKAETVLTGAVAVSIDRTAGVVTVRTTAPWPALAEQINRRLLTLVNTFNVERRSSSAAAQRDFARERLGEIRAQRQAAEAELRTFLERNRQYRDSPELVFEQARLQKELDLRQQVYTTLAQAYEQARIDAVRDTPLITIIEHPEGSARRAGTVWRNGVLALLFGAILALGIVTVSEYLARQRRESPEEYRELERAWQEIVTRVRPSARREKAGAAAD
ncbi:MAG: hypothetical protein HY560_14245 [Gemmatimonadetes bacterium]|nr:hypothetical protein [Gemmatimonadota bacterium]